MELRPGQTWGKFKIVGRLGEGGMATIYLAESSGLAGFKKPVALKLLRPDLAEKPEISAMLLEEARIAARLHHPNIVQVFDLGHFQGDYYISMEWVEGISLTQLLVYMAREELFRPAIAIHIAMEVAAALNYLREGIGVDGQHLSLVHRDVSPSNVLLSREGAIKLTDFGVVKALEAPRVTKVGVVKGKYSYMSPEQVRDDPVDHRSDLFSLGILLFEALTLRRLFQRRTLAATVAAVHAARVLPPSALHEDLSHEVDRVVMRALAKSPRDRFQSAEEFIEALQPFHDRSAVVELSNLVRILQDEDEVPRVPDDDTNLDGLADSDNLPDIRDEEFADLELLGDQDVSDLSSVADGRTYGSRQDGRHTGAFMTNDPVRQTQTQMAMGSDRVHGFGFSPEMDDTTPWAPVLTVLVAIASTAIFWWWQVFG